MSVRAGVVPLADVGSLDVTTIGGKASSLAQLVHLGLRVPPAFVITTEVCRALGAEPTLPAATVDAIVDAVTGLEAATGRRFGGGTDPLLLAVRSGAAVPMPGMMDTLLAVGFGPGTYDALAARWGEPFARSCCARFLGGWGTIVRRDLGGAGDPDLLATALGRQVPSDPREQLLAAVVAVCRSWGNERAHAYREHHGIDHELGTAVVVQAMVFGDRGSGGGSGVASSRDPVTGEPGLCGDFLAGAQGADVVDGAHRPSPIGALAEVSPGAHRELTRAVGVVETAMRDLVDVEFAVEDGVLHVLQHRPGARSAAAAVRIAVDLVDEGVIDVAEALTRVSSAQLELGARPMVAPGAGTPLGSGLGACPGVATGEVCFSADHVAEHVGPVILVREETSPRDVHGLTVSAGALTARGGIVSHAALVARQLDLPTVVGVAALQVDEAAARAVLGGHVLAEGDTITIDGSAGLVHLGAVPVVEPAPGEHLARLRAWRAAGATPEETLRSPGKARPEGA